MYNEFVLKSFECAFGCVHESVVIGRHIDIHHSTQLLTQVVLKSSRVVLSGGRQYGVHTSYMCHPYLVRDAPWYAFTFRAVSGGIVVRIGLLV